MALKKTFHDDDRDVTYTDAYWRLVHFSYSWERQEADLLFSAFSSEVAAAAGRTPIASKSFRLTGDEFLQVDALLTAGFKAQVYEFAKQQPDFADATDV